MTWPPSCADARGRLDALETGDEVTDLRAVFSWSYRKLSPPAARMFRLLGLHQGPDISAAAAASLAGLPVGEARAALAELTRASLLTEDAAGRFGCHDLLRAYAAEQAADGERAAEREAARRRLADHYLRTAHAAASERLYPARGHVELPPWPPDVAPEKFAVPTRRRSPGSTPNTASCRRPSSPWPPSQGLDGTAGSWPGTGHRS